MTTPTYNSHRTTLAIHFEATPGAVPVNAGAWAADEGTDTARIKAEGVDPAFILGETAVPNADMQAEVFAVDQPHKGLPTADGGSFSTRIWGTGDTYIDNTQVLAGTESFLGRMFKHAFGGGALGHHTKVSAVTSNTNFTLSASTNLEVGYIILIEDADDPGRLFPVQVLTIADDVITVDRSVPFTIAINDKIYGTEMAWPDADALTNAADAGASTVSALIQKGPHLWMAGGGHLSVDEIGTERGQQPKVKWGVQAAKGYPQGAGAPSAPEWTGTVEGSADVRAIGNDTKCFLQVRATTTWNVVTLFEASIKPGVPVLPQDTVTEEDTGMPGRGFYRTEPGETVLELLVALTNTEQTRWAAKTELTFTYWQVAPCGRVWGFHVAKGFTMKEPVPVTDGTNRWRIPLQATHDESATTAAKAAKFIFFRG